MLNDLCDNILRKHAHDHKMMYVKVLNTFNNFYVAVSCSETDKL